MMDATVFGPRLFGIAYRMLGDVHAAEDVVQETLLRWQQADPATVQTPEAWLVSVATRLSIDWIRRTEKERAEYPGPWLPEPIADARFAPDCHAELASDLSMAFLVLLENLAPEERAAFLLREVFDADYDEIARTLEKSQAAVRQIVHRARERVRAERPRFTLPVEDRERMFERFVTALERDDKDELLAVMSPDATLLADGGGKISAARRMVRGSERIARMLLGIETKYGRPFAYKVMRVNGEPAMVSLYGGRVAMVTFADFDGDRMRAMYRVMNPDKLTRIDVPHEWSA
jgi:RNA polymerase sigma-70 factor (ECF subfamily)